LIFRNGGGTNEEQMRYQKMETLKRKPKGGQKKKSNSGKKLPKKQWKN
jgi:hypothetical protein